MKQEVARKSDDKTLALQPISFYYLLINHKNYNFLYCDWFKKLLCFYNM